MITKHLTHSLKFSLSLLETQLETFKCQNTPNGWIKIHGKQIASLWCFGLCGSPIFSWWQSFCLTFWLLLSLNPMREFQDLRQVTLIRIGLKWTKSVQLSWKLYSSKVKLKWLYSHMTKIFGLLKTMYGVVLLLQSRKLLKVRPIWFQVKLVG